MMGLSAQHAWRRTNFSSLITRTNYTPADYRTGYVQSWHFTVQRELGRGWILDVAYVGNRGVGLMILGDYNQARPNNPGENLSLQARRPIQAFTDIQHRLGRRLLDLPRPADQGGEEVLRRLVPAEFLHVVQGHRQRRGPPGDVQRR